MLLLLTIGLTLHIS